jgi:hypothetical protein
MTADEPSGATAPPRRDDPPPEDKPRRRGRPPKAKPDAADKPRVTDKPAEGPVDKDFTEACAGLSTLSWATLAAIPPTAPWAVVVEMNQEDLVRALNSGCQQSPKVRAAVEKWSSGAGGVWVLQLGAVAVNMSVQSLQLLQSAELRAEAKAHTEGRFREFLKANGVKIAEAKPAPEAADAPVAA